MTEGIVSKLAIESTTGNAVPLPFAGQVYVFIDQKPWKFALKLQGLLISHRFVAGEIVFDARSDLRLSDCDALLELDRDYKLQIDAGGEKLITALTRGVFMERFADEQRLLARFDLEADNQEISNLVSHLQMVAASS